MECKCVNKNHTHFFSEIFLYLCVWKKRKYWPVYQFFNITKYQHQSYFGPTLTLYILYPAEIEVNQCKKNQVFKCKYKDKLS